MPRGIPPWPCIPISARPFQVKFLPKTLIIVQVLKILTSRPTSACRANIAKGNVKGVRGLGGFFSNPPTSNSGLGNTVGGLTYGSSNNHWVGLGSNGALGAGGTFGNGNHQYGASYNPSTGHSQVGVSGSFDNNNGAYSAGWSPSSNSFGVRFSWRFKRR